MGHEEDFETYRLHRLESLSSRPSYSIRGASEPIQVYVNERRVGELQGAGVDSTLQVQIPDRIETVQLRTEEGTLLGGLAAPEYGFRTNRLQLSSDAVELCVHNMAQGGSLSAVFIPTPGFWSRTWKSLADAADRLLVRRPDVAVAYGMRTVAFTQAVLAIAVVGLVADRTTRWMTPAPAPSPIVKAMALPSASVDEIAKLELQLSELAEMQAKVGDVLGAQQKGMVQLQQAMAKLTSTQESVESTVLTVRQEIEKREGNSNREADRPTRALATKGQIEQEQLEAAIHSLTADNDRLSREVAGLEENNQALKTKLQSAVLNASKAVDPNPERLLKMADSLQATQQAPFLFWVTFSDGTSQESIDQWVTQMKGHKGAVNEGWQEVRIGPPAVPPDRFLEQIRGDKIVKAARISQ